MLMENYYKVKSHVVVFLLIELQFHVQCGKYGKINTNCKRCRWSSSIIIRTMND